MDKPPGQKAQLASASLAAIGVLLPGYVALFLLWRLGHDPANLPGLFHYHSATWGDGLLLPLLAFFLELERGRLPKLEKRWPSWVARAAGAAGGALVVFSWWADPKPSPNWTIPHAHALTSAGWWHAGFLVAASAYFAGSWVELLRRLRAAPMDADRQVMGRPLMAAAFGCTAGYAWLAVADSVHAGHTTSGRGSLTALTLASAVLIACMAWAAHGALAPVVRTAVAGLVITTAAVALTGAYGRAPLFMLVFAVASALGAGLALAGAPGHRGRFATMELLTVPALFAALTFLAMRTTELAVVVAAPVIAIPCSILLRHLYSQTDKRRDAWLSVNYLAGAGISASLLAAGMFGLWLGANQTKTYVTGGFLLTILGAILGGVFLPYFKADYESLMRIEGDDTLRQADKRPGDKQYEAASGAWVRLVGYAGSAFASMLVLTVALGPSLGWNNGRATIRWPVPVVGALVVLVLIAPALGAIRRARRIHPPEGPLAPSGDARYAWWCVMAGGATIVAGTLSLRYGDLNLFALLQSALLTAFAAQNILCNGGWLHTRRLRPVARLATAVSGLAVFTLIYWSLTAGIRPGGAAASLGATFLAWIFATASVVLLVQTTSCAVYVAGGRPYLTDYPPANNSVQDNFMMACMWFVLGWVPQVVMSHIPAAAHERLAVIGTILAGFLLLFGPAFLWILENNDTHAERQRRLRDIAATGALSGLPEAKSSAARIRLLPQRVAGLVRSVREPRDDSDQLSPTDFMIRLSGHTALQNTVAMTLATVTVIGIIGVSSGLTQNATGVINLPAEDVPSTP